MNLPGNAHLTRSTLQYKIQHYFNSVHATGFTCTSKQLSKRSRSYIVRLLQHVNTVLFSVADVIVSQLQYANTITVHPNSQKNTAKSNNTCLTKGWKEESQVYRSGVITLPIRMFQAWCVCLYDQAASASA